MLRQFVWMLVVCAAAFCGVAGAQPFPVKPVRIVTSGVGSSNDFNARTIAQGISTPLAQQVIVENRGSGILPTEYVAKSAPDGYTLLMVGAGLWIAPILQKTSYEAIRDFLPISLTNKSSPFLVVHPSIPAKNVKDLIGLAKTRPGVLNYSSGGTGTGSHLAGELFKSMAGVDIVRIHYKADAQEKGDLLAGYVQMTFGFGSAVIPLVKSGKLKILGAGGAQPSPLLPGVPTIASSGLPGYEAAATFGLYAPARTPDVIIQRLSHEVVTYLKTAEMRERFLSTGSEVVASSSDELAAFMKSDFARWSKLIKGAGIKGE